MFSLFFPFFCKKRVFLFLYYCLDRKKDATWKTEKKRAKINKKNLILVQLATQHKLWFFAAQRVNKLGITLKKGV